MNDEYGSRVFVSDHFGYFRNVGVWLVRRRCIDGAPRELVAEAADLTWTEHDEATMLPTKPTFVLPDDFGRALLDELTTHYNGHTAVQNLRRDYDAERKRVDTLTSAIIQVATTR